MCKQEKIEEIFIPFLVYTVSMGSLIFYLAYMVLNAFLFKTAVEWGWGNDIGWGSALILSLISSSFVVLHRYRNVQSK